MMKQDLNTTLANLARTFALASTKAKEQAARLARDAPKAPNVESGASAAIMREARKQQAEANRWAAHAAEADRGYLLATKDDLADPFFMHQYGEVVSEATAQGRIVYGPTSAIGEPIVVADIASAESEINAILATIGQAGGR